MTDTELYRQLLALPGTWEVSEVQVDLEEVVVRVHVTPTAACPFVCPQCHQACPRYDLREERGWRHLDSCAFRTYLVARVPRVQCPTHGIQTLAVPWATPHSRFTLAFACFAVRILHATRVQARAAALLRLSPAEVHYLMERVVRAGQQRAAAQPEPVFRWLTLDEKHYGRGQRYLTVLGDPVGKRVLAVAEGHDATPVKACLETTLSEHQRAQVAMVSLDLWPGFLEACAQVLPAVALVYDRFHVAQELNKAVDRTRQAEHRRLRGERVPGSKRQHGDSPLTKTKYVWLKNREDLKDTQLAALQTCQERHLETAKVWAFKEIFRQFFELPSVAAGQRFLVQWTREAKRLCNEPLTAVVAQFRRHETKLLNYLHHRFPSEPESEPGSGAAGPTNAYAEYLNAEIQEIRTRARGFRQFAGYRRAILFFLGQLALCPQTFP